jgi:hypothetical protein
MTPIVNETVRDFVLSNSVDDVTTSVGIVAIALLVALLVLQELVRSREGPREHDQTRVVTASVVPLLIAFTAVILTRAAELL